MEVIATKQGYFGKLRNVGDKFDVPKGSKASWFNPTKKSNASSAEGSDANTGDGDTGANSGGNDLV